jgi:hypothetical protein
MIADKIVLLLLFREDMEDYIHNKTFASNITERGSNKNLGDQPVIFTIRRVFIIVCCLLCLREVSFAQNFLEQKSCKYNSPKEKQTALKTITYLKKKHLILNKETRILSAKITWYEGRLTKIRPVEISEKENQLYRDFLTTYKSSVEELESVEERLASYSCLDPEKIPRIKEVYLVRGDGSKLKINTDTEIDGEWLEEPKTKFTFHANEATAWVEIGLSGSKFNDSQLPFEIVGKGLRAKLIPRLKIGSNLRLIVRPYTSVFRSTNVGLRKHFVLQIKWSKESLEKRELDDKERVTTLEELETAQEVKKEKPIKKPTISKSSSKEEVIRNQDQAPDLSLTNPLNKKDKTEKEINKPIKKNPQPTEKLMSLDELL